MTTPNRYSCKRQGTNPVLYRPFKSPFRTPLADRTNPPACSPVTAPTAGHPEAGSRGIEPETPVASDKARIAQLAVRRRAFQTPQRKPAKPQAGIATATAAGAEVGTTVGTEEGASLHASCQGTTAGHRGLTRASGSTAVLRASLVQKKREIDFLVQSLALMTSNRNHELHEVISKWRSATRLAADQVHAMTKTKIQDMGGPRALRDREREHQQWYRQWDSAGDMAQSADMLRPDEDQSDAGQTGQDEKEDSVSGDDGNDETDEYTMTCFLKSLGVEFSIIGYDAGTQEWVD